MDCSRSCLGESGGQTVSQSHSSEDERHGSEDERQRQQERLNREESYYQFINELSDEDYRLMRDRNLLGTPDSETLGENSTSDSLLDWLNTFRHTGNSTRSGHSGNQTWRAVSRADPNSGEFRFSLEININHEHNGVDGLGEELDGISHAHTIRSHLENRSLIADSPVASRTRSRTLREAVGPAFASSRVGNVNGSVVENSQEASRLLSGRLRRRNQSSAGFVTRSSFLDDNEHNIIRQRRIQRVTPMRLHRGRARARTHRSTQQRPEVLRLRSTLSSRNQSVLERQQGRNVQQIHTRSRQTHTVQPLPGEGEEVPSSLGITLEEEELTNRSTTTLRRHPTITLDLQVRRIRPGQNRDQDSIATRTRSRVGMAENLVSFESDNEGFRRTISRSEHAGIRTYVSTIRIPLRRISETALGESSSAALRSILRQIMTGFGELSSLMDTESDSEVQGSNQDLSDMQSELSSLHTLSSFDEFSETSVRSRPEQRSREWHGETNATQHYSHGSETPTNRQSQASNNFVENGTLPILRLVPYLLLDEDANDHFRGLTKDQIDNLSTRNYGNVSAEEGEISKTCSVCINEYVAGNKLRQLPCMHEFHFHCIDRWLSENSTCPICRQAVVS
ncbi:E3 ubiquitin-protein ligase RNF6 isoform X2 [Tiliqua scincoides]|uniref:E3 ubiquitin-protein ligase RNF6 isoform X2 n=1 Tax=Tiliqua scincoides TaxID=71010 RepID=UPI003461A255